MVLHVLSDNRTGVVKSESTRSDYHTAKVFAMVYDYTVIKGDLPEGNSHSNVVGRLRFEDSTQKSKLLDGVFSFTNWIIHMTN